MRYREAIPHLRRATSSGLFPGAAYNAPALALEDLKLHQEASRAMREAGTHTGELSPDQQANADACAGIFSAYDERSLESIPEDFRSTSVHFEHPDGHIVFPVVLNGSKPLDTASCTSPQGSRCYA
jgi:hypothetical protein